MLTRMDANEKGKRSLSKTTEDILQRQFVSLCIFRRNGQPPSSKGELYLACLRIPSCNTLQAKKLFKNLQHSVFVSKAVYALIRIPASRVADEIYLSR